MNGLESVSDALIAAIKAKAPSFDGKGIAVPSLGNVFLLIFEGQAGGDYTRVGLDDRNGEFFYVRLKSGEMDESKKRGRGACASDSVITAKCRLVAQSDNLNPAELVDLFAQALRSFRSRTIGDSITRATVTPKTYNIDFSDVVKRELSDEERDGVSGWEGARYVAAIDFELTYVVDCSLSNCEY